MRALLVVLVACGVPCDEVTCPQPDPPSAGSYVGALAGEPVLVEVGASEVEVELTVEGRAWRARYRVIDVVSERRSAVD